MHPANHDLPPFLPYPLIEFDDEAAETKRPAALYPFLVRWFSQQDTAKLSPL